MDAEYGLSQDKEDKAFHAPPNHLDVDLHALTKGAIDWPQAIKSMQWMVDKATQALEDHKTEEVSQFLAKTCVMHMLHTFHACRTDKGTHDGRAFEGAPECGPEEEPSPSQPPSEKE